MIQIQYTESKAGLPNCFAFLFPTKDDIPQGYGKISEDSTSAELSYYLDLMNRCGVVDISLESGYSLIWAKHYDCVYKGYIPFTMLYDEDYDTVSFAVDEKYMNHRAELAEAIRSFMELTE